MKKYYQQGDVLVKEIEKDEVKGKLINTNVIKSASNQHALSSGEFLIYDYEGLLFLDVKDEATITHAEHNSISIPKGCYRIETVLEYDHFLEESKEVID